MLRLRQNSFGLGQSAIPFQDEQESIIRAVPQCFMSKDMVPAIEKAQQIAAGANIGTGGSLWNPFTLPEDVATIIRNDMTRAYYALDYWKNRLSTEDPQKQYCVGKTDGQFSSDRQQMINALVEPLRVLYQQQGAENTKKQAVSSLISDLTSPSHWLPNLKDYINTDIPTWAKVAGGVAAAALAVIAFRRISPPSTKVEVVDA